MTPAELKCALGFLGVSTRWLAARVDAHQRTVVRWCDGESLMPRTVAMEVEAILLRTADAYAALKEDIEPDGDGTVLLRTYRTDFSFWQARPDRVEFPASWHRQMVARLAAELPEPTRIEYFDTKPIEEPA